MLNCYRLRYTSPIPPGNCDGNGPNGCYTCEDLGRMHQGGFCGHINPTDWNDIHWGRLKDCMEEKCGYSNSGTSTNPNENCTPNPGDCDYVEQLGACCNGEDCIETTRGGCAGWQPPPGPIGGPNKSIWQGAGTSCISGRCPHIVIPGDIIHCDCAAGKSCYQCTDNSVAWAEGWHCCNEFGECDECVYTDSKEPTGGIYEEKSMVGDLPNNQAYCSECKASVDACLCAIGPEYCQSNNAIACSGLSKAFKDLTNFTRWWNQAMDRCRERGLCPQQPILQPEEWENLPDRKPPFFNPYNPQECPGCGPMGCKECMIQELGLLGHHPWTPEEIIKKLVALRKCQSDHSNCFGFMLDPENKCCPCWTAPCAFGFYRPNQFDCDCVKIVQHEEKRANRPLKKSNIERQKFWEGYTNDT